MNQRSTNTHSRGRLPCLTLLLEHEHGLWGRVDRERMGSLHRAATLTWHAVTASRVGKPQALEKEIVFYEMPLTQG